jgi:hypothetical protein
VRMMVDADMELVRQEIYGRGPSRPSSPVNELP